MSFPTSDDPIDRIAPMPDWRSGVKLRQSHGASVWRSRSGLEQRQQRRERPLYGIEYSIASLPEKDLVGRVAEIRRGFREPWWVPVWTDGIALQSSQATATTATLAEPPIEAEWIAGMRIFFWSATLGGHLALLDGRSGRNLTLASPTPAPYGAGALVFPVRVGVRQDDSSMLQTPDIHEGRETFVFRLSQDPVADSVIPENALLLNGEPLTLNGEILTLNS